MRSFDRPGRSAAYGTRGMAATSAPLATLAAIDTRALAATRLTPRWSPRPFSAWWSPP